MPPSRPGSAALSRAASSRPSSAATSTFAVDTVRRGYIPVGFQDLFTRLRDDDDAVLAQALKTLSLTLDMATNKLEIEMLSEMVRDNALTRVAGLVGEPRKELSQPSLLILACVTQPEFDPQAANARKLQLHDGTFTAA